MIQVAGVMRREPIQRMAHENDLEAGVSDLSGQERSEDGGRHVLVGTEARQTAVEPMEISKLAELIFDECCSSFAVGDDNELLFQGDDRHAKGTLG